MHWYQLEWMQDNVVLALVSLFLFVVVGNPRELYDMAAARPLAA